MSAATFSLAAIAAALALAVDSVVAARVVDGGAAFAPPPPPPPPLTTTRRPVVVHRPRPRRRRASAARMMAANDDASVNGAGGGGGSKGGGYGGLVLQNDVLNDPSLLASAFASLNENDRYDAVLTGLCAKILDGGGGAAARGGTDAAPDRGATEEGGGAEVVEEDGGKEGAFGKLTDPIRLLAEMNGRKVKASGRSLMALVDAAATTEDPRVMSTVLSLSISNGSSSQYGSVQSSITPLPPSASSLYQSFLNGGSQRSRQERLDSIPPVPTDDRIAEVSSAVAASGLVGACLLLNWFGPSMGGTVDELVPLSNLVLFAATSVFVLDNFYDAVNVVGSMAASTVQNKVAEATSSGDGSKSSSSSNKGGGKGVSLPEKGALPFGIGTGQATGSIYRGLTRLLTVDTERECQCEAAAFFAAYGLGLPCFAFRPNALEAAVLIFESMKEPSETESGGDGIPAASTALDPLLSDVGLLKVLIWLLAPVALESSRYPQLIASDPREAKGLLTRLKQKADVMGASEELDAILGSGDGGNDEQEAEDLLRWAYAEADLLLRNNRQVVDELAERLAGGAATVGDCVAVLEEW